MIFETPRLQIRPLTIADLEPFHEMQGNTRVMQYTTGRAMTREENEKSLTQVIGAYAIPENTFRVWAVERKSDREFLGTCALILNEKGENEIGYRFLEKYWGNGYGKEIISGLIQYARDELRLESLVAYVSKKNIASVKLLDRSAFQFINEFFNEEENGIDRYYRLSFSPQL